MGNEFSYTIYVTDKDKLLFINKEDFDYENEKYSEVEITDKDMLNEIIVRPMSYRWHWIDGKPILKYEPTEEELAVEKHNKICRYKSYLSETDYVISKLNELKLEDDAEYEKAKAEYSEVLVKRKEARAKINELEAQEAKPEQK